MFSVTATVRTILDNWYFNTHNLQIDVTSHCNARCAFCVRQQDGTAQTKPELELKHFDTTLWDRLVSKDTRGWFIKELTLNGNWGDPMMHPTLVEMLDKFAHYHPETQLFMHTNGSMRSTEFWNDLAESFRKFTNHTVIFAVDGMKDTHSIYRVRTNWDKILENIKSFTNNKGRARVVMTVFKHNIHQIKQVEEIAKECGCIEFETRESHGAHTIQDGVVLEHIEVEAYQTRLGNDDYSMSDNRDFGLFSDIKIKNSKSKCPWYNQRQVQIDPWGTVWPCCHTSLFGRHFNNINIETSVDSSFVSARKDNNLENKTLREILNNQWYEKTLKKAVDSASWKICRETCGVSK